MLSEELRQRQTYNRLGDIGVVHRENPNFSICGVGERCQVGREKKMYLSIT